MSHTGLKKSFFLQGSSLTEFDVIQSKEQTHLKTTLNFS